MSEDIRTEEGVIRTESEKKDWDEKKKSLLEKINAGIDPTIKEEKSAKKEPVSLDLPEDDKVYNEQNFKKLIDNYEKLTEITVKKDVDKQRDELLGAIKSLNEESYEEEKDNYSLNELASVLRTLNKTALRNDKGTRGRDVGATEKDGKKKQENTQWDSIKKDWVPG